MQRKNVEVSLSYYVIVDTRGVHELLLTPSHSANILHQNCLRVASNDSLGWVPSQKLTRRPLYPISTPSQTVETFYHSYFVLLVICHSILINPNHQTLFLEII